MSTNTVTVVTGDTTRVVTVADSWDVDDHGYLDLRNSKGDTQATYAPGTWRSVHAHWNRGVDLGENADDAPEGDFIDAEILGALVDAKLHACARKYVQAMRAGVTR